MSFGRLAGSRLVCPTAARGLRIKCALSLHDFTRLSRVSLGSFGSSLESTWEPADSSGGESAKRELSFASGRNRR